MGNENEKILPSSGSNLLKLADSELAVSLLTCAFLFPPCRSWQLLSWHTPCSGPLACSSTQLSPAAMSPALTPSFLSTVPTSKLPETLPGMVKGLRCIPGGSGSYQAIPGGPLASAHLAQLSAWARWSPEGSCCWAGNVKLCLGACKGYKLREVGGFPRALR